VGRSQFAAWKREIDEIMVPLKLPCAFPGALGRGSRVEQPAVRRDDPGAGSYGSLSIVAGIFSPSCPEMAAARFEARRSMTLAPLALVVGEDFAVDVLKDHQRFVHGDGGLLAGALVARLHIGDQRA
jgi:hypothetical protein